jgi:hypothetical protein
MYFYLENRIWGHLDVYEAEHKKTGFFPGRRCASVYRKDELSQLKKDYPNIKKYTTRK